MRRWSAVAEALKGLPTHHDHAGTSAIMRSASAEPCGTSPGVRFGNAAQTLHSICPTAPLRRRPKRHHMQGALQPPPLHGKQQRGKPQCNAQATLVRKPGSATTTKAMASTAPHARVWAQFGAVTERATRNPTKVWATTSDACKDEPPVRSQRLAAPPSFLPPRSCRAGAAGGTWLATTSAAANRGRDTPNTGRITAPASTPPPSCPAADQGWNCRPPRNIFGAEMHTRWAASSASAGTPTLSWLSTRGTCRRMPSLSAPHCKCPTPAAASAKAPSARAPWLAHGRQGL